MEFNPSISPFAKGDHISLIDKLGGDILSCNSDLVLNYKIGKCKNRHI